jgi:hypothetical protein
MAQREDRNAKIEEYYLGLAEVCTLAEMALLLAEDAYVHKDGNPDALEAFRLLQKAARLLGDARRE